jgi:hypothetical protein
MRDPEEAVVEFMALTFRMFVLGWASSARRWR